MIHEELSPYSFEAQCSIHFVMSYTFYSQCALNILLTILFTPNAPSSSRSAKPEDTLCSRKMLHLKKMIHLYTSGKEKDTFVYIRKRKWYFCILSQTKTFFVSLYFSFGCNYLIKETKPWNTKLIILFVINNSKNLRKSGKNNLPQYSRQGLPKLMV